jgi:hypothetical protein
MARAKQDSLRYSGFEMERLLVALLLSLLLHLAVWGGYEGGKKLGWWEKLHQLAQRHQAARKIPPPAPPPEMVEPEIFVDVSHPEAEAPKPTKYYSNKNSIAANPNANHDEKTPKIEGSQKNVPKTEDAPRLVKLQPTPPQQQPTPQEKPQPQPAQETPPTKPSPPASPLNMGDLQLAKLTDPTATSPQQPQHERPRTLKQAQAQQPKLPGQAMQQNGGVRRQRVWSSLDARATAFGDYDRAIVEAVTDHWYALLDSRHFAQDRTGKVILRFKLRYDGSITEMQTLENTVGETLNYVCQEAVEESAPFAEWPPDMRRMIAENYRDISFTFYYY